MDTPKRHTERVKWSSRQECVKCIDCKCGHSNAAALATFVCSLFKWLTVIVNMMVNNVIVVNDAQYGIPAIIFNATHGV